MRENGGGGGSGGWNTVGSGEFRRSKEAIARLLKKFPARSCGVYVLIPVLVFGALICTRLLDYTAFTTSSSSQNLDTKSQLYPHNSRTFPLNCKALNQTKTCPRDYPTTATAANDPSNLTPMCPEYFRWIHEDLRPWARTGITRDMVDRARRTAAFRLVILNGRAYLETFEKAFQTRDVFTIWGILQLLRRYPGRIPDLELMFDCVDWPVIKSREFTGPDAPAPPPLFRYCGDDDSLDLVFPDWSFWGWPEINIKPWNLLLEDLKRGNKQTEWIDREPYAYWKGNPKVAETRQDLLKCNVSNNQEWNARLYEQDWGQAFQDGYKKSDLSDQCVHRYKIYIEGSAWSVSEKYILACNSVTLLIKPHYYDFFTRGLRPLKHYWPLKEDDKCKSIKFAVDWGNNRIKKAQEIAKTASEFIQQDLKMDYVYDYMFHLLSQYSMLLQFKPTVPEKAVEICPETMACEAVGTQRKFMEESMVMSPAERGPCMLPAPYNSASLYQVLKRKENTIKKIEMWEKNYWENRTISQ